LSRLCGATVAAASSALFFEGKHRPSLRARVDPASCLLPLVRVTHVSPASTVDLERANALVTRALEVNPSYYAAYYAKAIVLKGNHRVRDAVAAAEL
jgi:hypothetical protein